MVHVDGVVVVVLLSHVSFAHFVGFRLATTHIRQEDLLVFKNLLLQVFD